MKTSLFILLMLFSGLANALTAELTYSWDSNPAADQVTQYQCEYSVNNGAFNACVSVIVPPANSITHSVLGVVPGDVITFRVRACNVVGCSAFTAGVSATVPPNLVPSVPTGEAILPMVIN